MCGLGGVLRCDGRDIPDAWLDALDEAVAHRGPDGRGRFRDTVVLRGSGGRRRIELAMTHRRLSVIDHAGGAQPMVSEQGRDDDEGLVAVVFNGFIANHEDLRRDLEARHHAFRSSHSDTEVLLHGYREWGGSLPRRLNGMYAAAVWDGTRGNLLLVRDLWGQKPLYIMPLSPGGDPADGLAFCSTPLGLRRLAALADIPWPGLELDGVQRFLQLGYLEWSPPVDPGAERAVAWMVPPRRAQDEVGTDRGGSLDPDLIEQRLDEAVARRLEADVPVGCFLSGGIDSSLVAHFAVGHRPGLRTYCVRMPDARFDESAAAAEIAAHLGTRHETLPVEAHPAEDLVALVQHLDQPFADSSILPTLWVCRAARRHVTVALSGDGGDELFVGYERYLAAPMLARFHRPLAWLPRGLFASAHPRSRRHKLGRLGDMARDLPSLGVLSMESIFTQAQIAALTGDAPVCPASLARGDDDPLALLRDDDLGRALPGDLLRKVDIASMAVALEVRCPFLDTALWETLSGVDPRSLLLGGRRKGLLRSIAARHLPSAVVDRPKSGFAVPIGRWFREDHGGLRTLLMDTLDAAEPFGPLPVDARAARGLADAHLLGEADHGHRLFALLTLAIWSTLPRS